MLNRVLVMLFLLFSVNLSAVLQPSNFQAFLFSEKGREKIVEFNSEYSSEFTSVDDIKRLSEYEKLAYKENIVIPLMKYIFGPLTYRSIGGVKAILELEIAWDYAFVQNSAVILPYHYKALWMLENSIAEKTTLILPIPKNKKTLLTKEWKKCTDRDTAHQTESFYWYFWDPTRYGCDHQERVQYDLVSIDLKEESPFTKLTYPEYKKMIKIEGGKAVIRATFAFGYVKDLSSPQPDVDADIGVAQFRKFISEFRNILKNNYQIKNIYLREYKNNSSMQKLVIGKLFKFKRANVNFEVKVVANAGVDQMDLFAKSFAHDHDSYFAWLGHSRVGSGFDAQVFQRMLANSPDFYSVSKDYQLVYWGGCNSYSYYAEPFFKIKASVNPDSDPTGSKGLDIIANALPSLFVLNARSSLVQLRALINFDRPTSYQDIIKQMEDESSLFGTKTLAVVLGDEDNED